MEVRQLSELDNKLQTDFFNAFLSGYHKELSALSVDPSAAMEAIRYAIDPELAYALVDEGQVVSIMTVSPHGRKAFKTNFKEFRRILGLFKTILLWIGIDGVFNVMRPKEGQGYIQCVATGVQHRGKGYAKKMFQLFFESYDYLEYLLDVEVDNQIAIKIYKDFGFEIIEQHVNRLGLWILGPYKYYIMIRK